ncbi:MAG TPA: NUDIX domain-containing protein [Aldersonia sp.]
MTNRTLAPAHPRVCWAARTGPTAGTIAQTTLATDAAAVLHRVGSVSLGARAVEVSAALDAVRRLRTDLRTLRPILDRGWSVRLRGALEPAHDLLAAIAAVDDDVELLAGWSTDPSARPFVVRLAARRDPLLAMVGTAVDPATVDALESFARGVRPAPLRTVAPLGDAHQPSAVVVVPMLYRRWRKLVKQTDPGDLPTVARRARECLIAADLVTRAGPDVSRLVALTGRLLRCVRAAALAERAGLLGAQAPAGALRDWLACLAAGNGAGERDVVAAHAQVASSRGELLSPSTAPLRVGAGGLVVRHRGAATEVLLVHRNRHDDWSIPKGTALPGESAEQCALREVCEETGLRCRLQRELHAVSYRDRNGRVKVVRYWLMAPLARECRPDPEEIDQTRWVHAELAKSVVARQRDRAVLNAYLGL